MLEAKVYKAPQPCTLHVQHADEPIVIGTLRGVGGGGVGGLNAHNKDLIRPI